MKYPIYKTSFRGNEQKYINQCFKNNWISSSGPFIKKFENKFSKIYSSKFALSTSNGTTALELALMSLNLKPNDKVIVPNLTFAATINSIINVNLDPVLCDVGKDDYNIDIDTLSNKIDKKIKAILIVHLYGKPCKMKKILNFAKKNKLYIIEDCAEAIGSKINNKLVGTYGDCSTFSFFGNKTLTTGEGGMIIFKNKNKYNFAKKLRDHGMSFKKKYWHEIVGKNYRMTDLQAAVGLAQLEKFNYIIRKKIEISKLYKSYLKSLKNKIKFVNDNENELNTFWLFNIIIKNRKKNYLIQHLKKKDIEARPFFYCLSNMPPYKKYAIKEYKNSKFFEKNGVCLPSYIDLNSKDIKFICNTITKLLN